MLTRNEVTDLLTAASAYDNRQPNPAALMAWGKAAELARWTFQDALAAIHAHYAESTDFLMPAHITTRVKANRQDRALRAEAMELEQAPSDPAAAARIQEIIGELAGRMGWADEGVDRLGFALKVRCPHCHAAEGQRCTQPKTGDTLRQSACHPARAEALGEQLRGVS